MPLTLVSGGSYAERESAIAAAIAAALDGPTQRCAVLLEGLPAGDFLLLPSEQLTLTRIAPGCFCCIGNLTLRVSLNRILRKGADRIYLGIASDAHLTAIFATLQQSPYDQLLLADSGISL